MMAGLTLRTTVEDTAMGIRRAAAALLLSGAVVVATAPPVFAEPEKTVLDASSPHADSLVAAPRLIVLSFTGHVTLTENPITVVGKNGVSWAVDKATAVGPVVTAPVRRVGPPGPYTLTYKMIDKNGDPVTGSISITLIPPDFTPPPRSPSNGTATAAPPGAASPSTSAAAPHGGSTHVLPGPPSEASSTNDSPGIPAWVWILGAAAVLGVGLLEALRVGRAKKS
jgi:methionine-rich copper-binding protein CopC